jgi:hypothetical protein
MYSIRSKKKQGEKLKEGQGKEEAREGEERGEEERKRRKRRRSDKREKQKKGGQQSTHNPQPSQKTTMERHLYTYPRHIKFTDPYATATVRASQRPAPETFQGRRHGRPNRSQGTMTLMGQRLIRGLLHVRWRWPV